MDLFFFSDVCVCVYTHVQVPRKPEEDIGLPGSGVGFKLLDVDARN